MSRQNPNELTVLNERKFEELCAVLGVKQLCVLDPDRKVIEKAFRRNALKCHPDKGGDPVVFKKLNDAYLKLIGHIQKLEQKVEEVELNNSILIEISKTAVPKWQEKLKTRYGWFKSDNCKHLIFDGPYKQYMGRSKMTGNLTLVLYEDPEDGIPKIHVRSSRYMAWIAEMMLPSHLHVNKDKAIQFDQWRMANLTEFGIYFFNDTPRTPMPDRKDVPLTPAAKKPSKREMRKREREANAAKEKEQENGNKGQSEEVSEKSSNKEPCKDENNNSNQTFNSCDDSRKHSKTNGSHSKEDDVSTVNELICDLCSEKFQTLSEKNLHKKMCFPQSDFFSSGMEDVIDSEFRKNGEKKSPAFICEFCGQKFTNMVWHTKHLNSCVVKKEKEQEKYESSKEEDDSLSAEKKRVEEEKRQKEKLEAKKKHREKLEAQKREKEELEAENKKKETERIEAERKKKEVEEKKKEKERLESEKKKKEDERLDAEKKMKEAERLEAEKKIKEAERLEAEKKRKEADKLEDERKKKIEAERLEAEKKKIEAERLEAEEKKKEAKRIQSEKERIDAETQRLACEKKKIEADRLEAKRKKIEAERLKAEKRRIEAEAKRLEDEKQRKEAEAKRKEAEANRLKDEKRRKEAERLEAETKRKEAEAKRLEDEKQRKEAEEDEKQRKEAERNEAKARRKEAEANRLKDEKKRKEAEMLEAETKRKEAEKVAAEQKKKEADILEAEKKKREAERLEAEKKRIEAEAKRLEDEKRRNEAESLEAEKRVDTVEKPIQNLASDGGKMSNNAKVQELMQRKEQERVIRENLKKETEFKVKEKDELRVKIKFEAEQELKKNKSFEVQEKKSILLNGKSDSSSFYQDANADPKKLPLTRDTGARNSEFAFNEKNRRENETSNSFAKKVSADVLANSKGQSYKHDTAVKANTVSATKVHHSSPDTFLPASGLKSPERDSVFIPHDKIQLRGNDSENVARQFYVVNRSMSPPVSKTLSSSEVNNNTAGSTAVSSTVYTTVGADTVELLPSNSVSNKIFRDYASRQEAGTKEKDKTFLDRELDTLDKRHAVKLENITDGYKEQKKIDLANKDVNSNRPVTLGPSRFDSTGGYSRPSFTSQPAPKRNSSSQSKNVIKEPTPTSAASSVSSSKSGITKSFTTADLMSPTSRRRFDTNFNAMPEPYKPALATEPTSRFDESRFYPTSNISSDFSSQRDAPNANYGVQRNYSSYSTPQSASIPSLQMPASYVCPPLVTTVSTVTAPSSSLSSMSSRARSEGNGLILSQSSQYKDFYNQIQVTKDRYKSDVEKAMSFDRSAIKPPIIRERLPRPDNSHSTLGRERRVDREATVMKTIEGARRGKSDDLLRSSSFRH